MNPDQPTVISPQISGGQASQIPPTSSPDQLPVASPQPLSRSGFPTKDDLPAGQAGGAPNPNSTQNALHISEIRDGIVIMNDGTFRAVIMCKSINFDLMSPQEREAVEFAYQGFLNSLYFPIQIFIRSQKVDLGPYLDKLDKIRSEQESMLLALLMEDYIAFLSDVSQQTNIMDKRFYMVISYPDAGADIRRALRASTGFFTGLGELFGSGKTPHVVIDEKTLENAKTELKNRVQAAMQGLLQCGVQSVPLDTQELIELYYEAYNPETAARQQLGNASDLTAAVIGKGVGNAPSPNLDRTMT